MKVLFIGATGIIGRVIVPLLQPHFDLHLAALEPGEVSGFPVQAVDIRDFEATAQLVANSAPDAVVNCAIADYKEHQISPDPEVTHRYHESTIEVNVRGAYHLYEAAARAHVPKFVFISTMFVTAGPSCYEPSVGIDTPRPMNFYACTKHFGEQAGADIARPRKMSVTYLRLGHPYPLHDGLEEQRLLQERFRATVVHMEDIAAGVKCALENTETFGTLPVVSRSDASDPDPLSTSVLGYSARHHFTASGPTLIQVTNELGALVTR
jgi:nucleoside-diphosphate-sugar epimerase